MEDVRMNEAVEVPDRWMWRAEVASGAGHRTARVMLVRMRFRTWIHFPAESIASLRGCLKSRRFVGFV
jgi:hypothetical protein